MTTAAPDPVAAMLAAYQAGQWSRAATIARGLLEQGRDDPAPWQGLCFSLVNLKRGGEALPLFQQAVARHPEDGDLLHGLGRLLREMGRLQAAAALLKRAVTSQPGHVLAWHELALAWEALGELTLAEAAHRRFLALRPRSAAGYNNLANVLKAQRRLVDAEACYRQALVLQPELSPLYSNLGDVLWRQGRWDEAEAACRHAVTLQPGLPEAHNNLGNVLLDLGRLNEADASYRQAAALRPGYDEALHNIALILLHQCRWAEGWALLDHRMHTPNWPERGRRFPYPLWQGEPLGHGALLLWGEQGVGDVIQFVRYFPLLRQAQAAAALFYLCPASLERLLAPWAASWEITLVRAPPATGVACHLPLFSLPQRLMASAPPPPARLTPPAEGNAALTALPHPRVGVAWAGNPDYAWDRFRSLPPERLAPLLTLPGVSWVSLQAGAALPLPPTGRWLDPMAGVGDFADTAALIAPLDLVITVDTAVAHLAASLDKPVWLLNRFNSDWRWLHAGEVSPWYPGVRIFRQERPGDWEGVITRVVAALSAMAAMDPHGKM